MSNNITLPGTGSVIATRDDGASHWEKCDVDGVFAHDAAAATAQPVLVGGFASAAAPTSVSADGDAVQGWYLRNGAQCINVTAAGALIPGDATNGLYVNVKSTVGIAGTVAQDAAAGSVSPLLMGGFASAAAPAAVSADGDAVQGWYLRNGAQCINITAAGALIPGDATSGLYIGGAIAHDGVDSGNPSKIGAVAIAHGTNPTAVSASLDRTNLYANRAGILFTIGGHPNILTYGMSITTGATNAIIGPTIGTGLKLVVTAIKVTLDNASTVFPSVVIGFAAATTPAYATTPGTLGVLAGHPGVPAGGGFTRGDGSGIIGIGGDGEELRITTVGTAGGNGLYIEMTGFTIES